jgi:hypothetical protein
MSFARVAELAAELADMDPGVVLHGPGFEAA